MMHSQEMYDQLPIMPHSTCGAILKEWGEGGILGNLHTYFGGGGYSGKCTYIFWGGYSGKFAYILGGGILET